MSRAVSSTALRAMFAQQTEEVFVVCIRISHPSITTIRICGDSQTLARSDGDYLPWGFEVALPEESADKPSQAQIRIDNVDRQIAATIRSLAGQPQIAVEVVLASSPDTVEAGPFDFNLLSAQIDALTIVGTLGFEEDVLGQGVPSQSYTPINSPGLFP